jgi:hypothetical protein
MPFFPNSIVLRFLFLSNGVVMKKNNRPDKKIDATQWALNRVFNACPKPYTVALSKKQPAYAIIYDETEIIFTPMQLGVKYANQIRDAMNGAYLIGWMDCFKIDPIKGE